MKGVAVFLRVVECCSEMIWGFLRVKNAQLFNTLGILCISLE